MTGGTSAFNGTGALLGATSIWVGGVDQGRKQRVDRQAGWQVEAAVFEVAQARGEAVAEEGHEPEDVVGGPADIDRVLLDRQPRLMIEQAIEHMRRLAGGRGDHLAV